MVHCFSCSTLQRRSFYDDSKLSRITQVLQRRCYYGEDAAIDKIMKELKSKNDFELNEVSFLFAISIWLYHIFPKCALELLRDKVKGSLSQTEGLFVSTKFGGKALAFSTF